MGLWDYEVVEVFLLNSATEEYLELEFGPHGYGPDNVFDKCFLISPFTSNIYLFFFVKMGPYFQAFSCIALSRKAKRRVN